jgi:RNA polymerase sigma-70 factor, ECF subfamily
MSMFRRNTVSEKGAVPPPSTPRDDTADKARLDAMFREHHETVWRTLRRSGLDAQAAADAGQQAFVVAIERLDRIRHGSERAFLIGSALRIASNNYRKARRLQFEEDMDLHVAQRSDGASDKLSDLELVDAALARMDPDLVEVFILFELEGFSSPEIAEALDVPLGTVASRLRRAREGFREAARRLELAMAKEENPRSA